MARGGDLGARDGLGAALAVTVLLTLLAAPTAAWPALWIDPAGNYKTYSCTLPTPATLLKGHNVLADTASPLVTFTVADASGVALAGDIVCAGKPYALKVAFTDGRNYHWLLISSVANTLPNADGCTGQRMYAPTASSAPSFSAAFNVPASGVASIVFSVAASVGSGSDMVRSTKTVTVDASPTCNPPPPSTSPSPSPSPSPSVSPSVSPSPSPSPSPPPSILYGDGGGVTPPTAPNPPYSGKCAAAGSCAQCASATRCFACSSSGAYVLNDKTGQCDCAPGYMATKASTSSNKWITCAKCTTGKVSVGGGTGVAVCAACPTGTTANAEGSLCVPLNAWQTGSRDYSNRRWNSEEFVLSNATTKYISTKWSYVPDGDVSATPAVFGGRVFFPTWRGSVVALNNATGAELWKVNVVQVLTAAGVTVDAGDASWIVSRTGMAHAALPDGRKVVLLGTMRRNIGGYPYLIALNVASGATVWVSKLDDHPAALLTMAPAVTEDSAFMGVSSLEESRAGAMQYPCCSFRGSFVRVDLATGAIRWKFYTTPAEWSGAAVWGSTPVIDKQRGAVYFSTGDNYNYPPDVETCLANLGTLSNDNIQQQMACENLVNGASNYRNAVVAVTLATGELIWGTKLGGADAWNGACMQSTPTNPHPNCPDAAGPDYDFGQAPMLITVCRGTSRSNCKNLLVVGQKAGIVWGIHPDTGRVDWWRQVGPGGTIGGMMWGSASDNERVYVSNNNFWHRPLDMVSLKGVANPSLPANPTGGHLTTLDAHTGKILWTFANPMQQIGSTDKQALSQAPITVANGVVLYPSMDATGMLFVLNAVDGRLLTSFAAGASNACGASIVNGHVFTGSGYTNFGLGNVGQRVTALTFTPALVKCGTLTCLACEDDGLKCKGSPWCPACGFKGCEDTGVCRT